MRVTQAVARQRFDQARVANLGTVTVAGAPHLVPVTFAVIDAALVDAPLIDTVLIVFAVDHKPKSTTELRRLDNIAANPAVTFLVDSYDEDWERLWWVRADATAEILEGPARLSGIAALQAKYDQYKRVPPDGVVVGAVVSRWTGWQASPTSSSGANST